MVNIRSIFFGKNKNLISPGKNLVHHTNYLLFISHIYVFLLTILLQRECCKILGTRLLQNFAWDIAAKQSWSQYAIFCCNLLVENGITDKSYFQIVTCKRKIICTPTESGTLFFFQVFVAVVLTTPGCRHFNYCLIENVIVILTHCSLVTPYGSIRLNQRWLR